MKLDPVVLIYPNSSFDKIAEHVYVLLMELRQDKALKEMHLVLDGTVKEKYEEKKSFWKVLFGKKDNTIKHYEPFETVNIPIKDLNILPYSFAALIEEIHLQNPRFSDCHSFRISLYYSNRSIKKDNLNEIWVHTEDIGKDGKSIDQLKRLRYLDNTNVNRTVYIKIPSNFKKELKRLEQNLFKWTKNSNSL
ncbi:MAG: hypothetical protein Q8Q35_01710 [Nanoarchaeota archaeon]|nr:hypothetical protein [Nanoarchaeota archaeon]